MIVGLLTIEQKDQLIGHHFGDDEKFNPVQDADGNWIISTQEMYGCINPDFLWVKDLPTIEWKKPIYE